MSVTIDGTEGIDKFEGTTIAGHVIQVANYTTGVMSTGTASIPADNTIPQITEGTQFMSLAFAPKKATSKLKITTVCNMGVAATQAILVALFKDSNPDCVSSSWSTITTGSVNTITFVTYINAIDTNSHTFTVRVGASGASTVTFNGSSGVAYFGGSLASSITIEEIAQ